jgi:hypothetical protein
VLFLGGTQLAFIGVLGEYLGRLFDESKARPIYLIKHLSFAITRPAAQRIMGQSDTAGMLAVALRCVVRKSRQTPSVNVMRVPA